MSLPRIVCIVEGHGDAEAVPVLVSRVLHSLLGVQSWAVDREAIRQPRSRLVDESTMSPRRICNRIGLELALSLAAARDPSGVLVVCDADDDCPASWGSSIPSATASVRMPVHAVMASREYESWVLAARSSEERLLARAPNPDKAPRDAKKALARLVTGYAPSTHQVGVTRQMDLQVAWATSDSFDKLVRSVAALVGTNAPSRPGA